MFTTLSPLINVISLEKYLENCYHAESNVNLKYYLTQNYIYKSGRNVLKDG